MVTRNGQVIVLEAVIAATLLLALVIAFVPDLAAPQRTGEPVLLRTYSNLEGLDANESLRNAIFTDPIPKVEDRVASAIPPGRAYTVARLTMNRSQRGAVNTTDNETVSFGVDTSFTAEEHLLLVVSNSSNFTVSVNAAEVETLPDMENRSTAVDIANYTVDGGNNFTVDTDGRVNATFEVLLHELRAASEPEDRDTVTVGYFVSRIGSVFDIRELKVLLWQE